MERINSSRTFARSARHRSLLKYLVEAAVAGNADADKVKEMTIAADVFGRDSYDPQIDSQVRVEVAALRERLEKYYAGEGSGDAVRIEIPKGSYEPVFRGTEQKAHPPRLGPALRWSAAMVAMVATISGLIWAFSRAEAPPAKPSIAVLPFEDLSAAKDQEYFSRGMTEELIGALANMQIFRVIPRSRVDRDRSHAHAVVEGSVRRENNRVRVVVRLVETKAGTHLWSATYDREFGQVLEIQREIAESVARAFNLDLSDTRRALIKQSTRNAQAYDHYLRATYLYTTDVERSLEFYKAAIAADPGYALAWAGLAGAWNRLTDWYMVSSAKAGPNALTAAAKALSIDPRLAEAQHVWGVAKLLYERNWLAAEKALLTAIELDPIQGEHRWEYTRLVLLPTGRFAEADDQMRAGAIKTRSPQCPGQSLHQGPAVPGGAAAPGNLTENRTVRALGRCAARNCRWRPGRLRRSAPAIPGSGANPAHELGDRASGVRAG